MYFRFSYQVKQNKKLLYTLVSNYHNTVLLKEYTSGGTWRGDTMLKDKKIFIDMLEEVVQLINRRIQFLDYHYR